MTLENQPDNLPTRKALTSAVMAIAIYHLGSTYVIPPELLGAYTVILEYAIAVIGGLLLTWPLRDRAGVPIQKPE